jgi:hypothetical protein
MHDEIKNNTTTPSFLKQYRTEYSSHFSLKRIYHHFIWIIKGVQVFALVGKSGTGKSFRAKLIEHEYNIDLIIDDGLLIKDQKILAGGSAKRAPTKVAAIKAALFMETSHLAAAKKALEKTKFKRVLIIGTSEKMVKKIAERVGLPALYKIIKIEDVASDEEIQAARDARSREGKHIIPVPAVEVKKAHSKIFFQPVRILIKRKIFRKRRDREFEKSIVRPPYSAKGAIVLSEEALSQMVYQCVKEFDERLNVVKIIVKTRNEGYDLDAVLDIPYGIQVAGIMYDLQRYILESIEKFAGIVLHKVNITVGRLKKD